MVTLDLAPAWLADLATDVAFRPGGGLVAIIKRETDPGNAEQDRLRRRRCAASTRTARSRRDFGAGGETALTVGEPDTNATALLERRGMLWVTGSTQDGVQTDGFLARVDANGNGLQFRRFDIRGTLDATETVADQPQRRSRCCPERPRRWSSSAAPATARARRFGAAAFNDLDGDVASMPYGDVVFGSSGPGEHALVGAAADGDRSLAFVGLTIDSSLDSSFITAQLKLDADKVCDLAVDVPAPLEITYRGKTTPTVTLTVENKGKKACAGTVTTAAPFALGRAVTTGAGRRGREGHDRRRAGHVLGAPPRRRRRALHGHRRRRLGPHQQRQERARDLRVLRARAGRDPPAGDRALRGRAARRGQPPQHRHDLLHARGAARARRQRRRRSASPTRSSAARASPTRSTSPRPRSREGRPQGHPARHRGLARGRHVADRHGRPEVRASSASATAASPRAGARSFSGTASSGRAGAKADRTGVRLRRVEVAVRALGKGCRWLSGKSARIVTKKLAKGATCRPQGWQSASGSSHWRLSLRKSLPRRLLRDLHPRDHRERLPRGPLHQARRQPPHLPRLLSPTTRAYSHGRHLGFTGSG